MRPFQSQMREQLHICQDLDTCTTPLLREKVNLSTEIALFSMLSCQQTSDSLDFLTIKEHISTQIKECYLTVVS